MAKNRNITVLVEGSRAYRAIFASRTIFHALCASAPLKYVTNHRLNLKLVSDARRRSSPSVYSDQSMDEVTHTAPRLSAHLDCAWSKFGDLTFRWVGDAENVLDIVRC